MNSWSLEHLADDTLIDGLHHHARLDHQNEAALLAHIAEVSRRRFYAEFGHPSMKAYCVKVLRFSEDAAKKRIQVAHKAWLLPVIFEAMGECI